MAHPNYEIASANLFDCSADEDEGNEMVFGADDAVPSSEQASTLHQFSDLDWDMVQV